MLNFNYLTVPLFQNGLRAPRYVAAICRIVCLGLYFFGLNKRHKNDNLDNHYGFYSFYRSESTLNTSLIKGTGSEHNLD